MPRSKTKAKKNMMVY